MNAFLSTRFSFSSSKLGGLLSDKTTIVGKLLFIRKLYENICFQILRFFSYLHIKIFMWTKCCSMYRLSKNVASSVSFCTVIFHDKVCTIFVHNNGNVRYNYTHNACILNMLIYCMYQMCISSLFMLYIGTCLFTINISLNFSGKFLAFMYFID